MKERQSVANLRSLQFVILLILLPALSGAPYHPAAPGSTGPAIDELAWLTGTWIQRSDDGARVSEEHWIAPAGGTMFGINRLIVNDRTAFYEFLRIEQTDQGLVYFASPKGRHPPTAFKLTHIEEASAVFENPDHDFPQIIMYRREGATLSAESRDVDRIERWTWTRQ